MKRDFTLIRQILMMIEGGITAQVVEAKDLSNKLSIDETVIIHHLQLLFEAKMITSGLDEKYQPERTNKTNFRIRSPRLTWIGHDFLDSIRNENLWNKVRIKVGELSFDGIKALIMKLAVEQF